MRRLVATLLAVLAVTVPAQANDFAVLLGYRSNSASFDRIPGVSVDADSSFQAGVLGFFDFTEMFGMRAGFVYAQRNYTLTSAVGDSDISLGYFDIPATFTIKFADYARAFIGPVLALNVSDKCEASGGCAITEDPDSVAFGLQLGVMFKFAPQFGGEIFYELIPSFWDDGLEDSKTVGANFLITFE